MKELKEKKGLNAHYDFLIIGSGLAGLYAANYGSKFGSVALITKSTLEESNSYWAQGGIAAAMDPEDSTFLHLEDTILAGRGICSEEAVHILVNEGKERIFDLIEQGMEFDTVDGGLELGLEGGHSRRRVLHAGGSATGKRMIEFLIDAVSSKENIDIFEGLSIVELIKNDGRCAGAVVVGEQSGESRVFLGSSTILAIGGASSIYTRTTNPPSATGDGIAIGWEIGAEVADMEFTQFHPTALYIKGKESFLLSEALRGEGAHLVNGSGERFMHSYSELGELAPRDIVSRAIYQEIKSSETECVFLILTHLNPDFIKSRFQNIYEKCRALGLDITKEPIPVAPAAHYTIGGIKTDLMAESSIPGLFACGEVSCTFVHGANRLASNSLLECMVFSKRSIDGARKYMNIKMEDVDSNYQIDTDKTAEISSKKMFLMYLSLKNKVSVLMNENVGIVRSTQGLNEALGEFEVIEAHCGELRGLLKKKLANMLTVCRLITKAALMRRETRGAHIRENYPDEDENWKLHIIWQKDGEPYFERL